MAIICGRSFWSLCCSFVLVLHAPARAEPGLFRSTQLTPAGEYTFGIEGPAVDLEGNLFVVNFGNPGTVGRLVAGSSTSEKFIELPQGSVGNSIRFDRNGTMFIADYKKHNIYRIAKGGADPQIWFHSDLMNQPNDMTVARDGAIYASDPNWKSKTGQIWRIAPMADGSVEGQPMTASRVMGTTNGIDLGPDGKTLYVGESNSGQIWSYTIRGNELADARLIKTFEPNTIDGLRTDVSGRLLIARILKGKIMIMKPDGMVQREVALTGKEPTNLAFGGSDGRTVFVTQRRGGFVESFRTDREGREHCLQRTGC